LKKANIISNEHKDTLVITRDTKAQAATPGTHLLKHLSTKALDTSKQNKHAAKTTRQHHSSKNSSSQVVNNKLIFSNSSSNCDI
jgi:hypothetical protein